MKSLEVGGGSMLVTALEISECDSALVKGFETQGASGGLVIVSVPVTDVEAQSVTALCLWPWWLVLGRDVAPV